ncbi:Bph1p [Cyberlindnera jadinii NRRL Y-1542]|uniref:Beach-domain-containing protein n=2 Tax=Cyberlindnera jadinii (strain ATCC 18201 / CBS 1600 / BCRC 20928 / JCM 3617 / NBRC 0987 / NRRL Y-1542) TaxID=983966 RepID=A0A1E4RWU5_CYBJN|nr:beach-domain-containing protein [Cyberlindnera jadinii NRRL Y-1542]ODV71734.1 beach-domain-containing protein [Cyberlindnera jadinii NRRL Y-1542]
MVISDEIADLYTSLLEGTPQEIVESLRAEYDKQQPKTVSTSDIALILLTNALTFDGKTGGELLEYVQPFSDCLTDDECIIPLVDDFYQRFSALSDDTCNLVEPDLCAIILLFVDETGDLTTGTLILEILERLVESSKQNMASLSESQDFIDTLLKPMRGPEVNDNILRRLDLLSLLELKPAHLVQLVNAALEFKDSGVGNLYTERLIRFAHKKDDSHIQLDTSSVTFQLSSDTIFKSFTIQMWINFNNIDEQSRQFLSIDGRTNLKLEGSQISVYHKDTLIGSFDSYEITENKYYHIVLIHKSSSSGDRLRAKLNLYINGDFIQYIRCPFPFADDEAILDKKHREFAVTLGSSDSSLDVACLNIFSGSLPFEWVALSYYLGPNYRDLYQDDDLVRFLNYQGRAWFNLHLLDASTLSNSEIDLTKLELQVPKHDRLLNFNVDTFRSLHFQTDGLRLLSDRHTVIGKVLVYKSVDVSETFYSIAALNLVFMLIEKASSMKSLYQAVQLLLELVDTNWKLIREMEYTNGYSLLGTLLKAKKVEFKRTFDIEFFDLLLGLVGYNFHNPFNSVIMNELLYEQVVLDFSLWKSLPNEEHEGDLEVLKFLNFQVIAFAKECKYNSFNIQKMKKIKLVKRFLGHLIQGSFPEKVKEELQDALCLVVRTHMSVDTVKNVASFIVYSLNEKHESNAILGLNVLASIYLDTGLVNGYHWKKLFSPVNMKYIFLLFQLGKKNKTVVDCALTLLVKLFLMSSQTHDVFLKNNGVHIVLALMREIKIDVEIDILINGSFGKYQSDLIFSRLDRDVSMAKFGQVVFPELHHLILDLLEWTVLNDIFQTDDHSDTIAQIDGYTRFLDKAFDTNAIFSGVFGHDKAFIKKLCNFVLLLNKTRNAGIYFDSSDRLIEVMASRVLSKLLNSDLQAVDAYLNEILHDPENPADSVTPVVYLALVFPKVLFHLSNFSSEFETLLRADSIKFSNIALFLNLLYPELLTFEWSAKDYFNYISVVLTIVEAYKKSGKSLKNSQFIQLHKNITPIVNCLVLVLKDSESTEQQHKFLKVLMFHQENLFGSGAMSSDVANIICLLLQIAMLTDPAVSSLALNCLRIILMRSQDHLSSVCSSITYISHGTALRFLRNVMTASDEDILSMYKENKKVSDLFSNHLEAIVSKVTRKFSKDDFVTVDEKLQTLSSRHDDQIKQKYESIDKILPILENDNEILRQKLVHAETTMIVKYLKDQYDVIQFHLISYNKMKVVGNKRLGLFFGTYTGPSSWILGSMEGIDRMRKKLLPVDDLKIVQQLKNIIDVPMKKLNDSEAVHEQPHVEALSLNSFDMVEEDAIEDSMNNYNDRNRKVLKSLFYGDKIVEIWNVSRIIGLEIDEGILILGQAHIYFIKSYFHKADTDEIIDLEDAPENERDPNVKLIAGQNDITTRTASTEKHTVRSWVLEQLTSVTRRQFLFRDMALEIFFSNGASLLITCVHTRERDSIFSKISSVATNSNIDNDLSAILKETNLTKNTSKTLGSKISNVFHFSYDILDATKKWQNGEMSNFYYLVIINTLAGRTFNDLTQYPVFPWVIADYTSEELDLTDPKSFRDFSKPMGAQTPQRAQQFRERYEALESLQDDNSPPFHYGTHYSSAMIVASFLIRLEPFVQSFLLLQGGKFDHADRLFYSIEKAWKSASSDNTTDVRELTPEFFFLPEFLTNINGYDFGCLQDGTPVNDVVLPKWAKGDPKIFIERNREALESPYVSAHLHEWIDLIFGFKQTGPKAVEAINVFNHLSYQGGIDLDAINNDVERRSIIGIIHNFGQTPAQIFSKPHPARETSTLLKIDPTVVKRTPFLLYQTKFNEPIHYLQFKVQGDVLADSFWRGYPKLYLNGEIEVKRGRCEGSLVINRKTYENVHGEEITALARLNKDMFITGTKSGSIHVWKYVVVVKGFKEELHLDTKFMVHLESIKELKVSPEFNTLLSLDVSGRCYVWNTARHMFIRQIETTADHIAIAYDSALIATSLGTTVELYNINGSFICRKTFDSVNGTITALNFANSRTVSTIKINNVESHEYWKHIAILTTGWSNGEIRVDELVIEENGWNLVQMCELKFADSKEFNNKTGRVTIVESYLKSFVDYEETRGGRIEVVAGDSLGRVAVWR